MTNPSSGPITDASTAERVTTETATTDATITQATIAQLADETDHLRGALYRLQRGRRGWGIAMLSALLIAALVMQMTIRDPAVMIGGGVLVLLIVGAIYWQGQRGTRQEVAMLVRMIEAREHALRVRTRAASGGPSPFTGAETSAFAPVSCPYCAAPLSPDAIAQGACPHCATAFKLTCPRCGTPVAERDTESDAESDAESATICPACNAVLTRVA